MNPRRIVAYFPVFARGYTRNPTGLFFSLVFPIILILIFGAVFSNTGSAAVPLYVQNLDDNSPASVAFLAALNETGAVQISFVPADAGNLSSYLSSHSETAGLVIPAGFGEAVAHRTPVSVQVYTSPSAGSSSGIVLGAVNGAASGFNIALTGGTAVVGTQSLQVGSQSYRYIDYLIPGLVGFSVLISPMFSMVNISSTWKRDKLFRQLSLTPLTRGEWLAATFLWFVTLAFLSAILLVLVGRAAFGAHVTLPALALPFLIVGPTMFVSLGLLAGSASDSPEAAAVLGNIITFPMMFLSGTFFPVNEFPAWLQPVAHALPLYYVIDGLNASMVFNDPAAAYADIAIVAVVTVVLFVVATRVFNWRED